MKRLSEREKRLAMIAVGLLALIILFQGMARPMRGKLSSVTSSLQERQSIINRANGEANTLYQLKEDVEALSTRRQALVIKGQVIPEMMRRVETAAKAADVGHVDIRPLDATEAQGYKIYQMQLQVKAHFPNVKNFLYFLEEGEDSLLIDRVELMSDKSESDVVNTTLFVSAYGLLSEGGAQ